MPEPKFAVNQRVRILPPGLPGLSGTAEAHSNDFGIICSVVATNASNPERHWRYYIKFSTGDAAVHAGMLYAYAANLSAALPPVILSFEPEDAITVALSVQSL